MFQDTLQYLKSLFATPSAEVIALRKLEEARRRLIEAEEGRDYAESMVLFHTSRIEQLTEYLRITHTTTKENTND
jgi:hypothetical protein